MTPQRKTQPEGSEPHCLVILVRCEGAKHGCDPRTRAIAPTCAASLWLEPAFCCQAKRRPQYGRPTGTAAAPTETGKLRGRAAPSWMQRRHHAPYLDPIGDGTHA